MDPLARPIIVLVASGSLALSGCSGFGTHYEVRPDPSGMRSTEARDRAIAVAARFAEEHGLPPTRTPSEWEQVQPAEGGRLLAQFGGLGPDMFGWGDRERRARIVLSAQMADDGALTFFLIDLDHGRETDYVRSLREDLERELVAVYGDRVQLRYHGKAGAPFVAP